MKPAFTEFIVEGAALVWPDSLRDALLPKLISGEVRVGAIGESFEPRA